jgi:hypothetical protein
VAEGLIGLEILGHLGQGEGATVSARGFGMGLAELQEGGIGQVGADRRSHWTIKGLQHAGWIDDLENPFPLQQLQRLAHSWIHCGAVKAGAERIKDHQFVEQDSRHLQQRQLLKEKEA